MLEYAAHPTNVQDQLVAGVERIAGREFLSTHMAPALLHLHLSPQHVQIHLKYSCGFLLPLLPPQPLNDENGVELHGGSTAATVIMIYCARHGSGGWELHQACPVPPVSGWFPELA